MFKYSPQVPLLYHLGLVWINLMVFIGLCVGCILNAGTVHLDCFQYCPINKEVSNLTVTELTLFFSFQLSTHDKWENTNPEDCKFGAEFDSLSFIKIYSNTLYTLQHFYHFRGVCIIHRTKIYRYKFCCVLYEEVDLPKCIL